MLVCLMNVLTLSFVSFDGKELLIEYLSHFAHLEVLKAITFEYQVLDVDGDGVVSLIRDHIYFC